MMKNKTRFNQFLDSIEGINPKILSARLKEMEKTGLIKRKVYSEIPVRVEYFLTEKGTALKSILDQMASFSIQYCSRDVFKGGKPSSLPQTYLVEKKQIQIHSSKLTVKIIFLAFTEDSFTMNSSLMNSNIQVLLTYENLLQTTVLVTQLYTRKSKSIAATSDEMHPITVELFLCVFRIQFN